MFEERFSAYAILDESHLAAAKQYILDNPVRAGLCEHADDWPWSGTALGTQNPLTGTVPRRDCPSK